MVKKIHRSVCLVLMATTVGLLPLLPAHAMTASQYFDDGNRLFRDDLYWAALLRYRQAQEEGMSTPTLHYNMGVAHYRAGQHIRARDELLQALDDPALRVTAQYNLGLNAYALGDIDEALRWFRLARDQNRNEKIQTYAVVAIDRIRDEQAQLDDFEIRVAEREEKRKFADLQFRIRVGFGTDDNVFRTPADPYVDRSDPAAPTVVPVVQSGAFIPLSLNAKYLINSLKFEGFYIRYRLAGRYYQDKELENANEYQHEASFGSEYRRKEGTRERQVRSAFTISQHVETYFDPDDGTTRDFNGMPLDDRLDYLRYGPELRLRQSHERLAIGATIKGQLWNYETQDLVPEYDHEYFLLRLYGQYKFTSSSLFRITAEGYSRRFGDRVSYDLDGTPRQGNPNIRYDYYALELTARQRIFGDLWFGFDAQRTERIDQYVGYYDYTRDSAGMEIHWDPGERFEFEARGIYHLYNYPNAFAFNNPNSPRKTHESAEVRLTAEFQMTRRLSLVAEGRYRETVSNDPRIQFERYQYNLGVRWEQ